MKFNLKLTGVTVENIAIGGVEYNSEYSTTEFRAIIDEFKTMVSDSPAFVQKIVEVVKYLEEETKPKTEDKTKTGTDWKIKNSAIAGTEFNPDFDTDFDLHYDTEHHLETGLDIDGDKYDNKVYRYAVYYFGGDSTACIERYPVGVSIPSTCGNYELDKIYHTETEAEQHVKLLML